jgi:hypothetical protein
VRWFRVLLLVFTVGLSVTHAKAREFAPAELIAMREVPGGVQYVVLNERCRLTGLLAGANRRPLAKVGDRIQYASDDKYLYLKDTKGAIHKLRYMLQELMSPPPPPPIRHDP